ncbi:MFS transporter [Periweissella fabaria]|uniref:MFS transporter n=1 Tax=Periweissella fabaria TaxID=546157 RepID=A0ABN8BIY2_9LACO|nr:MFS transporter [Periweissella fabaria]MCM0597431.1 MFS transporter [Periweissella fabaria]CAH0416064.1 hypothetical protein WFA24289_00363 [Periweissella fabaria]
MQLLTEYQIKRFVKRQIAIAVTSDFLSVTAGSIFSFAIGLHVLKDTNSILAFGSLQMVGPVMALLFSGLIGQIADTYSHKRIIISAELINLVMYSGYIVLVNQFPKHLYLWTILIVIWTNVTSRISGVAYQASVVSLVPTKDVQRLSGLEQASVSLAGIMAPVLGGILYAAVNFHMLVLIILIESLVVLSATMALNFHAFQQVPSKAAVVEEPSNQKSIRYWQFIHQALTQYPGFKFLTIFSPIVNFILSGLDLLLSVLIIKDLHLSATALGLSSAGIGIGSLIGGLLVARHPNFKAPIKLTSLMGLACCIPLISIGSASIVISQATVLLTTVVLMNVIFGIVIMFANVPLTAYLVQSIPQNAQGRVFSAISGITQVFSPLGILIYTGLLNVIPASRLLIIAGTLMLMATILLWITIGRSQNQQVIHKINELNI